MKNKSNIIKFIILFLGLALLGSGIVFMMLKIAIAAIICLALSLVCLAISGVMIFLIKKNL